MDKRITMKSEDLVKFKVLWDKHKPHFDDDMEELSYKQVCLKMFMCGKLFGEKKE